MDGTTERLKVDGGQLLDTFKALIHEGTVRRVVIKQGNDTLVEFPLTVGVVGAAFAPALAAVGAIAALVTDCSIEIERAEPTTDAAEPPAAAVAAGVDGGQA
jgi:hypothetical protein